LRYQNRWWKIRRLFLILSNPPRADGSSDLNYVLGVSDHFGKVLYRYKVIVNKCVMPVGAADKERAEFAIKDNNGEYKVVSNSEFSLEGVAEDNFMKPSRVVIGTRSERVKKLMSDLYAPFLRQENLVINIDERNSKLTKFEASTFLVNMISS
jgi:UDPglucose 6-dehydrogenase